MSSGKNIGKTVNSGFLEVALALGGVVASYELPDEAILDLAQAIDAAHGRVQSKLMSSDVSPWVEDSLTDDCGHPAVIRLLYRLDEYQLNNGGGSDG